MRAAVSRSAPPSPDTKVGRWQKGCSWTHSSIGATAVPRGLTKVFATSEGPITANLKGFAPNSFRGARNRGDNTDAQGDMTQDFVFSQRGVDGFGQTL